ncbi:hypothetical protein DL769_005397 [Monosporascus sp. CRB-8-3]|nr:hypothetical protein DL769_005397 [Monosporascus sp. CRB-8-3]
MTSDTLLSSITLSGSALSAAATGCVLSIFAFYPQNQGTLRHALVLNLTIADFINSLTNTISGSINIRDRGLREGPACALNGWIEQLSVQATDFSILAISLATLLVVTQKVRLEKTSAMKNALVCCLVWVVPLVTSTTAAAMGALKPVSGNWCWISGQRTDLRYGLTHGWRFVIIFLTIAIYSYIWWHLNRHFRSIRLVQGSFSLPTQGSRSQTDDSGAGDLPLQIEHPKMPILPRDLEHRPSFTNASHQTGLSPHITYASHVHVHIGAESKANGPANSRLSQRARQTERDVRRMLLLNGYPIMFVVLWIPGIINRIMEASGVTVSARVSASLQCPTQFVGLANAITYGLNQQWRAGR